MLNIISIRIGTTRSGKTIVYIPDRKHIDKLVKYFRDQHFSRDDLLDAFALYEFLALRAKRRLDSESFFAKHADEVQVTISPEDLEHAKLRANVHSAFQLRDLGKSLAAIEFIDL